MSENRIEIRGGEIYLVSEQRTVLTEAALGNLGRAMSASFRMLTPNLVTPTDELAKRLHVKEVRYGTAGGISAVGIRLAGVTFRGMWAPSEMNPANVSPAPLAGIQIPDEVADASPVLAPDGLEFWFFGTFESRTMNTRMVGQVLPHMSPFNAGEIVHGLTTREGATQDVALKDGRFRAYAPNTMYLLVLDKGGTRWSSWRPPFPNIFMDGKLCSGAFNFTEKMPRLGGLSLYDLRDSMVGFMLGCYVQWSQNPWNQDLFDQNVRARFDLINNFKVKEDGTFEYLQPGVDVWRRALISCNCGVDAINVFFQKGMRNGND